jgi:hypothetical protein
MYVIQTPAGHLVPVYVDVGAQSAAYTPDTLLGSMTASYTTVPVSNGAATQVTFNVMVPSLPTGSSFATRVIISSGPWGSGYVYSKVSGTTDQQITSVFQLSSS